MCSLSPCLAAAATVPLSQRRGGAQIAAALRAARRVASCPHRRQPALTCTNAHPAAPPPLPQAAVDLANKGYSVTVLEVGAQHML